MLELFVVNLARFLQRLGSVIFGNINDVLTIMRRRALRLVGRRTFNLNPN